MDQLTHTVRRSNWINIIRQCQDRPAALRQSSGLLKRIFLKILTITAPESIRREVCEQEELQKVTNICLLFVRNSGKNCSGHSTSANRPCNNDSGCCNQIWPPDAGIIKRYFRVPALQAVAGGASCLKMLPVSAES